YAYTEAIPVSAIADKSVSTVEAQIVITTTMIGNIRSAKTRHFIFRRLTMYAKQVSRLYEPIEPISLPWELRSLVSDLTIQNGTRSALAIVRRRIMQTEVARMMATPLSVWAFSVTEDFGLNPSAFLR